MIDLPDGAMFATAIADPRFAAAVAIAILAGVVRGFSGFGSALVYIPLMSAVYGPQLAVPTYLVIDFATGLAFLAMIWRSAAWRDILPMTAAALIGAQFGTAVLTYSDPVWLRWGIAALVLAVVAVLASGWRYRGEPRLPVTLMVGALSGLFGSAVQIAGPPVILYWLGGAHDPVVARANFIGYFALLATGMTATYTAKGLLSAEATALAILTGPLQMLAIWIGSRLFGLTSERTYRRVAYAIILLAAVASMPVWDHMLAR
jgi:uncharacterized membrane protein YfcA